MGTLMRRGVSEKGNQHRHVATAPMILRDSYCRLAVYSRGRIEFDTAGDTAPYACTSATLDPGPPEVRSLGGSLLHSRSIDDGRGISLGDLAKAIRAKRSAVGASPDTAVGRDWWPEFEGRRREIAAVSGSSCSAVGNTRGKRQLPPIRSSRKSNANVCVSGKPSEALLTAPDGTNSCNNGSSFEASNLEKHQPCKWVMVHGVSNDTLKALHKIFRFPSSLMDVSMLCGSILQVDWHPPEAVNEQCAVVVETQALNIVRNCNAETDSNANGIASNVNPGPVENPP